MASSPIAIGDSRRRMAAIGASRAESSRRDRELSRRLAAIPSDVDEATLLQRARQGDEQAFAELYARHQRPIYRYAVRMCGTETADDVVQETFLALLRGPNRFDAARGTFGGYLFGIARHLVLKQLGSRYEMPLDDGAEPIADASPDALDALSREERIRAVRAAIAALPPGYREVVVLCDLEEMDYQTAAHVIGCPIGTIRSRLHRGRSLLVARLGVERTATRG